MSNQPPEEFAQIGSDEEVDEALKPRKTLNLPAATAVLAGGAGLHAAFASDSTSNQQQAGRGPGGAGYGGFRGGYGQGQGPGGQGGNAAIGTVVSATDSQLVVRTQNGDVTVKLTGNTTYEITTAGKASDLKAGQQVVVAGQSTDGTITATTVRQGSTFGGFRPPTATPSR
jgi:hypothetical protein